MLDAIFSNGGRKLWLVVGAIVIAVLNEMLSLGVSKETIQLVIIAALGGSGSIALEDGLKGLFGVKADAKPTDGEYEDFMEFTIERDPEGSEEGGDDS